MKLTDYFEIAWKAAIIGFMVYFLFFMPKPGEKNPEYWEKPNFRTDTVVIALDYTKIPRPEYKYVVPPKVVLQYLDSSKSVNHIHLENRDSLIWVIDSLKNHITQISSRFIKLYPESPKLLYAELGKDSLRLDLLGISGNITSQLYSLNYDRFKYQWDNTLRAEKVKKKALYDWYAYGGHDFIQQKSQVSTEYSIYYGAYKLQGFSNIYISNKPELFLGMRLGYRLR